MAVSFAIREAQGAWKRKGRALRLPLVMDVKAFRPVGPKTGAQVKRICRAVVQRHQADRQTKPKGLALIVLTIHRPIPLPCWSGDRYRYQHLVPDDARPNLDVPSDILGRFLAYESSSIFIARLGSAVVASCSLVVVPNLTRGGSPYGLIENVVTHRLYSRRGYGTQILDRAVAAAWDAGCYKVMLLTGSDKAETLRFYLSAGFEQSQTGFQKRRIPVRSP